MYSPPHRMLFAESTPTPTASVRCSLWIEPGRAQELPLCSNVFVCVGKDGLAGWVTAPDFKGGHSEQLAGFFAGNNGVSHAFNGFVSSDAVAITRCRPDAHSPNQGSLATRPLRLRREA